MSVPYMVEQSSGEDQGAAFAKRLEDCREDGTLAFAELLTRLSAVRNDAMALTNDLVGLGKCCLDAAQAGVAILDLSESAERLSESMLEAIQRLDPDLACVNLKNAYQALDDVSPQSRKLSIVASFSAITSASLGGKGLDHHVVLMRELSSSLVKDCEAVSEGVQQIETAVQNAGQRISNGLTIMNQLEGRLKTALVSGADNNVLDTISERTRTASDALLETTRQNMRELIGNMQFSDAFAQRLEHAVTMLSNDMPGGRRIASAQVRQLVIDQNEVSQQILTVLCGLHMVCRDASTVFHDGGFGAEADSAIENSRRALEIAVQEGAHIDEAVREAQMQLDMIRKTNLATDEMFNALRRTFAQMKQSAINAALRSRTSGAAAKPLMTLASEVQTIADETGLKIAIVETNLQTLGLLGKLKAFDMLMIASQDFQRVAAKCAQLRSYVDAVRTSLENAMQRSQSLAAHIKDAEAVLAPINDISNRLALEADALEEYAKDQREPNEKENAALFDLYTMDRERVLHAEIFPLPETALEKAPDMEIDDDGFETF